MQPDTRAFVTIASRVFPVAGPVYQIGAAQGADDEPTVRSLFAGRPFVGIDERAGVGVDRVEDFERLTLADESGAAVVSLERLETIFNLQSAVGEMLRVLRPGGLLLVATSSVGPLPGIPWDYWRLTPHALSRLFVQLPGVLVGWSATAADRVGPAYLVACKSPVPSGFARHVEEFMTRMNDWAHADAEVSRPAWRRAWQRVAATIRRMPQPSAPEISWLLHLDEQHNWQQALYPHPVLPNSLGTQLDLSK